MCFQEFLLRRCLKFLSTINNLSQQHQCHSDTTEKKEDHTLFVFLPYQEIHKSMPSISYIFSLCLTTYIFFLVLLRHEDFQSRPLICFDRGSTGDI